MMNTKEMEVKRNRVQVLAQEAREAYIEDIPFGCDDSYVLFHLQKLEEELTYASLFEKKERLQKLIKLDGFLFEEKTIRVFIELINKINELLELLKKEGDTKTTEDLRNQLYDLIK